jgi:AcrR family transcriptional regulator
MGETKAAKQPETKKRVDKREAILDATLALVVERGFHDAPMSLVSKRAGASPGVIYHYFKNKDEIIQAIYERIHSIKHESLFEGYSEELEPKALFLLLWRNTYRFYRAHQREMEFLERYANAGFSCKSSGGPVSPAVLTIQKYFRGRSEGGLLKDWPKDLIEEMTFGLLKRLARQSEDLPDNVLVQVAESVYREVAAEE